MGEISAIGRQNKAEKSNYVGAPATGFWLEIWSEKSALQLKLHLGWVAFHKPKVS